MLEEVLKKVGFNDKESLVYLALLELGSQPASIIGKKTKINRSTTYLVLEGLIDKGFVNQYVRADVKYFTASDPQLIAQTLKDQEKNIADSRKALITVLPDFYALTNPMSIKPRVKFYEGAEGIKLITEDTLTAKETILSWESMDFWLDKSTPELQRYIRDYSCRRVKKGIPVKLIALDTPSARKYLGVDYPPRLKDKKVDPLIDIKWAPKDTPYFYNDINVYDNKVSMLSLTDNELFGVIIESAEIAKIHKSIFHMAWEFAKIHEQNNKKR
ncbi:hypothetical protein KKD70_03805 [Patescibacteria group bacterium]|nr:hypothetical protein [Patescibacteria group bacterium]